VSLSASEVSDAIIIACLVGGLRLKPRHMEWAIRCKINFDGTIKSGIFGGIDLPGGNMFEAISKKLVVEKLGTTPSEMG